MVPAAADHLDQEPRMHPVQTVMGCQALHHFVQELACPIRVRELPGGQIE